MGFHLMQMARSTLMACAMLVVPATAGAEIAGRPAIGADVFVSTDSDGTDVIRAGTDFDLRNAGDFSRLGIRVEKAWYEPSGAGTVSDERIFLQLGTELGDWQLQARVGTDGHTVIGSANLSDQSRFRKELFIERDIVETRLGVTQGIYSTFVGAAVDLPADDRNIFTVLAGVQEFTGDNVRFHLRGTFVHVLDPDLGLSAQLRSRYFHSTEPGEFDYYSPRYYAQALPVLQMRRFVAGWELVGAAGVGLQRDSESDWRRSDFAQFRFRSPRGPTDWSIHGDILYTNSPSNTAAGGAGYRYVQGSLGVTRRF